jgi:hypothetical protein
MLFCLGCHKKNATFFTFFLDIQNRMRYTIWSGGIGAGSAPADGTDVYILLQGDKRSKYEQTKT